MLKAKLEGPTTKEETKETIDMLAMGKTLGVDGLPNEFFKSFKDFLCPYILPI